MTWAVHITTREREQLGADRALVLCRALEALARFMAVQTDINERAIVRRTIADIECGRARPLDLLALIPDVLRLCDQLDAIDKARGGPPVRP